jgi:D-glycero-alpha-D-manno-heptose-7-phosphate kinase
MKNSSILVKSPTRVDLAGGTLDLWPLYNFVRPVVTINLAIDIWTQVEISAEDTSIVKFESVDMGKKWEFENFSDFLKMSDVNLRLFQSVFREFSSEISILNRGFTVKTNSESPIGGGLGGSSSLIISILKALHLYLGYKIPDADRLVHLAHNIESSILMSPAGTQDYFPAVSGGLNFISYGAAKIVQSVHSVLNTPLAENLLLVYTGRSHHSGLNNFEVLKSAVAKDPLVLSALTKIGEISQELKDAILNGKWELISGLFRREYDARIQLTPEFTSPEIESLQQICLTAGAEAVKICGAGGGGCVLVWVSPLQREGVIAACRNAKFQCLNAKPVEPLI